MKIIFHIGLTKTGTTSIQRFLDINYEKLIELGIYYPKFEEVDVLNYRSSGNGYGLYLEVVAKAINPDALKRSICAWINEQVGIAISKRCTQIIISSEAFCTLPEDIFQNFLTFLPKEEVNYEFVMFTREPYAWFFSSWLQTVKREGNGKWLDVCLDDVDFSLQPLVKANILKSLLPRESIHLIDYDVGKNSVVSDFLSAIGIGLNHSGNFYYDNTRINRSITKDEFLLIFWTNKYGGGNVALSEELHSLIYDDDKSIPFFFVSPYAQNRIYEYCDIKKINYLGVDISCDVIASEAEYFETLSAKEKNFVQSLEKIISFYRSLFQKTQALAVHKVNLYFDSEFKTLMPDGFDLFTYLILNEDVLFKHVDPYKHYFEYGAKDGRVYSLTVSKNDSEK